MSIKIEEKDKVLFAKLLLKITIIMLFISIGIKILGFNLFEADQSNKILLFFSEVVYKFHLFDVINILILFIQTFIFFRLSCRNKNIKIYYIVTVLSVAIGFVSQKILHYYVWTYSPELYSAIYLPLSFIVLIGYAIIIDSKQKYKLEIKKKYKIIKNKKFINIIRHKNFKPFIIIWSRIKKPILIGIIMSLYQLIVLFLRNLTSVDVFTYLYNFLLNFDFMILLIVTYYIFLKRENNLKVNTSEDFSIVHLLTERPDKVEFRMMLINLKENYNKFKEQDNFEKIVTVLYLIFFIIQEFLTLGLVIFIANLNNYLIECIFIIIAFLISKKIFGAFHFKSFILCFVVSNVSFFILSTVTMNVTSTFVIPIICGILLALISSKFIQKTNTTPYRGMSEEALYKISKNKNLNEIELNILIDFYCNRESLTKLTYKYSYSQTQICRFKAEAINKLAAA